MRDVVIAGIGQVPVGEHYELSLRTLASRAMLAAMKDAGGMKPQALYIGNFLGPVISHQENLGALLVDNAGMVGIEAFTVEAAGASGGAALRVGVNAIASGYVDCVLVLGVEKVTDMVGPEVEAAVAQAGDYDYEGMTGISAPAQAALLMQRYIHEHNPPREVFSEFVLIAHANAVNNLNAYFRKTISREAYNRSEMISDPLNLFDMGPYADGAAAVLLTARDKAPIGLNHPLVRVSGSSVVIDTLALHDRPDPLAFDAARISVERACSQAGILPGDVDLFEVCDAFSIYALLSLEAASFAKRGAGWKLAQDGKLALTGDLPILTMGGCKARGNPLAAVGVYQAVEAVQQLRGQAGANQIKDARRALIQCLGGPASTAAAHVLERLD
jgi:acetyl-CoA C-acetyltransferase